SWGGKCDGATGTLRAFKADGTHSFPLYLVDFKGHVNRVAIPGSAQWFRQVFLPRVGEPGKAGVASAKPTSAGVAEQGGEVYSQPDKVEPTRSRDEYPPKE